MKKIFTFAIALMGFVGVASAATIDDVAVCKHSYVLKFEDHLINGAKPGKGVLFGDGFFLDVTGGTVGTKGAIDLSDPAFADGAYAQYAEYGKPSKTWRLKNGQDVIAMKVTAKSKIIILGESHASRGPKITDTAPSGNAMQGTVLGTSTDTKSTGGVFEWVADDDRTIYIGSDGGDYFVSYLIVQANEAPGTPTVKVSDMMYDGTFYYKEVTCKANPATEEGSTEQIPTIVTYTTDGSTPTAASPIYKEPILCTKDMTVKFQAYLDIDGGKANEDFICDGADNEGIVTFLFDAPTITADGGNVTITSKYNNSTNYYSYLDVKDAAGDNFTLTESATVTAYTKIANGDVTFTSKSDSKDVLVLNAIKEKKVIAVSAGDVVLDEEATATSTTGPVYKVENGAISADKMDFFVKGLEFAVVKDAQYQVDGKEVYIKMNNTNITFKVAAGDSVTVKVITSKNSCKTLNAENDETVTTDRKNYVNVSGTTYGNDDVTAEGGNIIEFGLVGKKEVKQKDAEGNDITVMEDTDMIYTFQKYSGTGNIMISSIEITPAAASVGGDEVIWESDGTTDVVNWNGIYRFGLEGTDTNPNGKECIAEIPQATWERMKTSTFCMQYRPVDPTNYMIRVTTGWWSVQWMGENQDIAPWNLADRINDNGDGTYYIEVNFGNDPILEQLDAQHLLFTGAGYYPLKLYFSAASGIKNAVTEKVFNGAIYNLSGQKVDENYKGVVIVNGKKMLQK